MKEILYVDPPEGWRFGFPKEVPDYVESKDITDWVITNGYPKELKDKYGDYFYLRFFSKREQDIDS